MVAFQVLCCDSEIARMFVVSEYKEQRLSIVGASYSAEDITLQCLKFGAKNIVTSYRSKPMNFKWQSGIEERPLITRIDNNNNVKVS
jgi:trimethylamine monooxygenase